MIFVESELDKRGKLYKVIKEKGHIVELKRQDEKTLIRWILGMAKRRSFRCRRQQCAICLQRLVMTWKISGRSWKIILLLHESHGDHGSRY